MRRIREAEGTIRRPLAARLGSRCYSSLSGAAAGARHVAETGHARSLFPRQSAGSQNLSRRRRARSAVLAGAGSPPWLSDSSRLLGASLRAREARAVRRTLSTVASAAAAPPASTSGSAVAHPSVKSQLEAVFDGARSHARFAPPERPDTSGRVILGLWAEIWTPEKRQPVPKAGRTERHMRSDL